MRARRGWRGQQGKGYRTVEFEGFEILVGKADADNDRLTFGDRRAAGLLAPRVGAGGKPRRRPQPVRPRRDAAAVAEHAAQLAAWHSKARGSRGKVEVHLCRVADVRKPRGFAPGQVLLKRWDAVRVYPKGLDEPDGGD